MTTLQPRLVVDGAAQAIEFYQQAFDAKEVSRYADEAGRIGHAELSIGDASFNLKDEGDGDPAPTSLGGSPVFLCLTVDDIDSVAQRMVERDATVIYPISESEWGRSGRLKDPFGHVWMLSQA